jgi:hypothetical protein
MKMAFITSIKQVLMMTGAAIFERRADVGVNKKSNSCG